MKHVRFHRERGVMHIWLPTIDFWTALPDSPEEWAAREGYGIVVKDVR